MKFGLIGYPLTHSFSRDYFLQKFDELGLIDFSYENLPLTSIEEVGPLLKEDFMGFNVTIPYKEKIIPFLDDLDVNARVIGAVNTMVQSDNKWIGYNTDATGFRDSLLNWIGKETFPENALVLGTGGASKAVEYVLKQLGVEVSLVSGHFRGQYSYHELDRQIIENHQLIINTTPVGMYPNTDFCPELPYGALGSQHWLYDLIYNPPNTVFLTRGEHAGARIKNGLEMLRLQAEHAWAIWKSYGNF